MTERILVVDDEENIRFTFQRFLLDEGYDVLTASTLEEGLELLTENIDLIFLDILLGCKKGLELLRQVKEQGLMMPVVMITGSPDLESATEAVRLGAYDYICKPVVQNVLLNTAAKALEHLRLLRERETFRARLEGVFRCASEGIIITDDDLNIVEVNTSARMMLALDESVLGLNLDIHGANNQFPGLAGFCDIIRSRFEGEIYKVQRMNADNENRLLGLSAAPLTTEDGSDYGYVLLLRDQTSCCDIV